MVEDEAASLALRASRWIPHEPARVWTACTTKQALEQWWSPEDLRTTVRKLEVRPGGGIDLHVRYVPALLGPASAEAFQAARIPIAFDLRGRLSEVEEERLLTFDLALDIGKGGASVEMATTLELIPENSGTRVNLIGRGEKTPHWVALGQKNLEAQLERLALAVERSSASP